MRFILALILLFTPSLLLAGQRATFGAKDDKDTLVVTLADNGDVRIEGSGDKEYGLRIGGEFYLVSRDKTGPTVARASDLSAAVKKAIPAEMRQLFGQLGKGLSSSAGKFKIVPKGEKTINGRTGKLYDVSGLGGSGKAEEFVMSEDPALKPFGETISAYISAVSAPGMLLFGPAMEAMMADMQKVFALGTPLDAGGKFILTSLETVETKPVDFTLPAEPMTVDALAASFAKKGQETSPAMPDEPAAAEPETSLEDQATTETEIVSEPNIDDAIDVSEAAKSAEEAASATPADPKLR